MKISGLKNQLQNLEEAYIEQKNWFEAYKKSHKSYANLFRGKEKWLKTHIALFVKN